MQIIECKCSDCRVEFKVKNKRGVPPWKIVCPFCESKLVDITKINGCDENQDSM